VFHRGNDLILVEVCICVVVEVVELCPSSNRPISSQNPQERQSN